MFGLGSFDLQSKMLPGNIFNMILFDKLKTGDPIIDAISTTIVLSSITFVFQYLNSNFTDFFQLFKNIDLDYKNWFKKKHIVEFEGKISSSTNFYDNNINVSNSFSDRFRALWNYIIGEVGNNKTINTIKEYSFCGLTKNNKSDKDLYVVTQSEKFIISKKLEIYAITTINNEVADLENKDSQNSKKKPNKLEKITIQLFSYKSDVNIIKNFVEEITKKYILSLQDLRDNKKFIYTLVKNKYEENTTEMWDENEFCSTRTFSNIFFNGKDDIIKKLDFFIKNKDWYFEKGIPYSLGIGLHGPPGTGKTSLIKAIANYTKRHIVTISLKLIKTKKQLDGIFFEERYCNDNKKGSIKFDKKIIVFEDIDCIGEILMDREKKKNKSITGFGKKLNFDELTQSSKINVGDLLETIVATEKSSEKVSILPKLPLEDEPLTLDDILNLWDGIRETPGRIMIISSNHYYELDPALIRPGRIDITLELSYASIQIIGEIYKHLFNEEINLDLLKNINENFYSPAEIINIFMNSINDKEKFIKELHKNQHI